MTAETIHELKLEPQPIADQWMGRCSCGWHEEASLYQFDTGEEAVEHLKRRHAQHIVEVELAQ